MFWLPGLIRGSSFIYMKLASGLIPPSQIVLFRVLSGPIPIAVYAYVKGGNYILDHANGIESKATDTTRRDCRQDQSRLERRIYERARKHCGNPPKNAGAAFVNYCKKAKNQR